MPKICYKERNFNDSSEAIIVTANEICDEYMKQGYTLTLRQLYYQFVARDIVPNTMLEYKRIASIINDARIAGRIDWNAIEDRTRNLESLPTWDSPKDIISSCAQQFRYDWWEDQDHYVEVWVEKEALIGVIERVANRFRVPYFACRGYASQSELWRAGQRFSATGKSVKVLHLGDHDPSGVDMTRDNTDRLFMFGDGADIDVIRLALNRDQITRYRPPPNPAKLSDARATSYIRKHGTDSWELDALDPPVIDKLISDSIQSFISKPAWERAKKREAEARERIQETADNWED